jgi:N-carbamoyl-L-amino-acid hydrolase
VLRINPDRLLSDLRYLRTVGAYKTGVHRPTLSPEDIYVRQWLVERMREADLNADIDGIGNILGSSRRQKPIVLSGSHIETQNY